MTATVASHRHPFDAHLCARSPADAQRWAHGFWHGAAWAATAPPADTALVFELVRDSTDTGIDWTRAPVPSTPWGEGWMLGAYGHTALERLVGA